MTARAACGPRACTSASRCAAARERPGPSTASTCTCGRARSSRWWGSRAAARRRWPAPSSVWSGRQPGHGRVRRQAAVLLQSRPVGVPPQVQLVLQDPSGSLNPRHTVYEAVAEGLRIHGGVADEQAEVADALSRAGLRPPERFFLRYPHELSGGQRQRVVIAGALVLHPSVLVADEPVASLDASVRGEILSLLLRLRDDLGLSCLVVTHDLGLAWNIADRVAVMYLGRIVETGPVEKILSAPEHPYTQALLSVVPDVTGGGHGPPSWPESRPTRRGSRAAAASTSGARCSPRGRPRGRRGGPVPHRRPGDPRRRGRLAGGLPLRGAARGRASIAVNRRVADIEEYLELDGLQTRIRTHASLQRGTGRHRRHRPGAGCPGHWRRRSRHRLRHRRAPAHALSTPRGTPHRLRPLTRGGARGRSDRGSRCLLGRCDLTTLPRCPVRPGPWPGTCSTTSATSGRRSARPAACSLRRAPSS